MVKIRLRRMGAKKAPFYRIVVADSRYPRDGRFIEELGYYNPMTEPADVKVDADKVKEWMANGAQPTDTVKALLKRNGILAVFFDRQIEDLTETFKAGHAFIKLFHPLYQLQDRACEERNRNDECRIITKGDRTVI